MIALTTSIMWVAAFVQQSSEEMQMSNPIKISFLLKSMALGSLVFLSGCNADKAADTANATSNNSGSGAALVAVEPTLRAPVRIEALQQSIDSVRLSWPESGIADVSYRLYWSEDIAPSQSSPYEDVYEPHHTHFGLIGGQKYLFRVSTVLNERESDLSPAVVVGTAIDSGVATNVAVGSDLAN